MMYQGRTDNVRYNKNISVIALVAVLLIGGSLLSRSSIHAAAPAKHRVFVPAVGNMTWSWGQEELTVLQLINQHRQAAGCPAVQLSRELGIAAELHSQDMAAEGTLDHTGSDGSSYIQRARTANYLFFASGEVIGAGYSTPKAVVDGWMASTGHREIILTCRNTDIGIGAGTDLNSNWRYYWTAMFGQR
jgi:uncharacterized protein YkwD